MTMNRIEEIGTWADTWYNLDYETQLKSHGIGSGIVFGFYYFLSSQAARCQQVTLLEASPLCRTVIQVITFNEYKYLDDDTGSHADQ